MNISSNTTNPFIYFIKSGSHQISFIAKNSNAKQKFIDGLLDCSLEYSREHTTTKYAVEIHGNDDNRYRIQIDDCQQETFKSHENFVKYIKINRDKCISKMTLFLPQLKYEILDKVVLHDAQCFNYSDQLNKVIIDGCYNCCTLVVIMSAIGRMGYQDEMFFMKLIGSCPGISEAIFVFSDMDRVPKNEKRKIQEHHTSSVKKLFTKLPEVFVKWNILFIKTNHHHLDNFKLMLPNNQSVNRSLQHVSPFTRLNASKNVRHCFQFLLIQSNDIEYVIEKHFPKYSRFDKDYLMLLVRFVTCMVRWNGWLGVRQLRFPKIPRQFLDKYRRDHWHTQVCATLSDTEHERYAESQYFMLQMNHSVNEHLARPKNPDVEAIFKKYLPQSSEFDKYCLMLLMEFVTHFTRWIGELDIGQFTITKYPHHIQEMCIFFQCIIDDRELLGKWRGDHCNTQVHVPPSDTDDGRRFLYQYSNDSFKIYQEKLNFLSSEQLENLLDNILDNEEFGRFIKDLPKYIDGGVIRYDQIVSQLTDKLQEVESVLKKYMEMELKCLLESKIEAYQIIIQSMTDTKNRIMKAIKTEHCLELQKPKALKNHVNQMITSFQGSCSRHKSKKMVNEIGKKINSYIIEWIQTYFNDHCYSKIAESINGPYFSSVRNASQIENTEVDFINITFKLNILSRLGRRDKTKKVKKYFQKCIDDRWPLILGNISEYYRSKVTQFGIDLERKLEEELNMKIRQLEQQNHDKDEITLINISK